MTIRRKRKPAFNPEEDVGLVGSTSVTLTPPSDPSEHCSDGVPLPAVFLDAVNEPDELTPVGWVCNDITMWWPGAAEAVYDAHRAYACLPLEGVFETSIYIEDGPMCAEGGQPEWQSAHSGSWVYDISEGHDLSAEPVQQREDSLRGSRVVLINTSDHEDSE